MFGIDNLPLFLCVAILLNLYPGPDTFYVLGRSLSQGRACGVWAAFGISTGALLHTMLGACGISALLAATTHGYTILQWCGGLYLLVQGLVLMTRPPDGTITSPVFRRQTLIRVYRQGVLTNLLNPKVAIFFLAFIPQFISSSSPHTSLAFLILGVMFITTGTAWCLCLAVCSAALSSHWRRSPILAGRLQKLNGLLFIGLGMHLALARLTL